MKNQSIEMLRFVLMFWIVLFHFTCRYVELYPDSGIDMVLTFDKGGLVGVCMFFIISGFFFVRGFMASDGGIVNTTKFIINKYWRFYPTYLICVILILSVVLACGLPGREVSTDAIVINLLSFYHPHTDYVDSAHWYLSALFYIQVCCAFGLFLKNVRYRRWWLMFVFILGGISFMIETHELVKSMVITKINAYLCGRNIVLFILGMFLGFHKGKLLQWKNLILPVIVGTYYSIFVVESILLLVYLILFVLLLQTPLESFKFSKPVIRLTSTSFVWYLVHQNIGYVILNILNDMELHSEFIILIPCFSTLALALFITYITKYIPTKLLKNG